jgi:hypothetical protein
MKRMVRERESEEGKGGKKGGNAMGSLPIISVACDGGTP